MVNILFQQGGDYKERRTDKGTVGGKRFRRRMNDAER